MRRLLAPRWLVVHTLAVCLVLSFAALGWWQLHRAESGNTRSFAYALEWPSFALLVIGFWVKVIRDELRGTGHASVERADGARVPSIGRAATRDADTAELAAYNRYLAARASERDPG